MPQLWTPIQAAAELGISARYVRRLIREGTLKAECYRRRLFIDPTDNHNRLYIEERESRVIAGEMAQ